MKIAALNASYRAKRGHTRFLLERMAEGITAAGGDCDIIDLAQMKINRCLACDHCHKAEHRLQCVWDEKDDVRNIFNRMAAADLLIYATPVYVFSMSALLKTLLERMYGTGNIDDLRLSQSGLLFHHIDAAICSKPFVTLVCYDNLEDDIARNILDYFNIYSRFMDAPCVGRLARNGGRISGFGTQAGIMDMSSYMKDIHQAFIDAGYELAVRGKISQRTQRRASRDIIPLPFFSLLKKIPARPVKEKFLEIARRQRSGHDPDQD